MQNFKNLLIYNRSMDFCAKIYKFSNKLPPYEKFSLTSQICRAATSIPLNISEGAGTASKNEFAQFITYTYRSLNEVLTCLELIKTLNLVNEKSLLTHLLQDGPELSKAIYSFYHKLRK